MWYYVAKNVSQRKLGCVNVVEVNLNIMYHIFLQLGMTLIRQKVKSLKFEFSNSLGPKVFVLNTNKLLLIKTPNSYRLNNITFGLPPFLALTRGFSFMTSAIFGNFCVT